MKVKDGSFFRAVLRLHCISSVRVCVIGECKMVGNPWKNVQMVAHLVQVGAVPV